MKICCLVGASGVGKSSITNALIQNIHVAKRFVTYTTRTRRINEEDGVDYNFVTERELDKLINDKSKTILIEDFPPMGKFAILDDGQIDCNSKSVYVIDGSIERAKALVSFYGEKNVYVIHIYVNDETRLLRMIGRTMIGDRNYIEVCRRFLADHKIYSKECFKESGLRIYHVENINLIDTITNIAHILKLKTIPYQKMLPVVTMDNAYDKKVSDEYENDRLKESHTGSHSRYTPHSHQVHQAHQTHLSHQAPQSQQSHQTSQTYYARSPHAPRSTHSTHSTYHYRNGESHSNSQLLLSSVKTSATPSNTSNKTVTKCKRPKQSHATTVYFENDRS